MIYNRPEYWLAKTETVVPYLTFSSPSSFTLALREPIKRWDGTLEYSTDTSTWYTWNGTTTLSSATSGSDNVLYLRGSGNTKITGRDPMNNEDYSDYSWHLTGSNIACNGDIEVLLDYATVESGAHPIMSPGCYCDMFANCIILTKAPKLPATTLADSCYSGMFYGCGNLTQVPKLPATTLADYCYAAMFNGCTSLKFASIQNGKYTQEYRIPSSGIGITATGALDDMFTDTGGTFTRTPKINTTYYLSNTNTVV